MKTPIREQSQTHVDSPPRIFLDGSMYFTYDGVRYLAEKSVPAGQGSWSELAFIPPPEDVLREAIMLLELSR